MVHRCARGVWETEWPLDSIGYIRIIGTPGERIQAIRSSGDCRTATKVLLVEHVEPPCGNMYDADRQA